MLDSKQCEAFFAVAETGSFEHAGQRLCITPSAVTLRVQALEKHLGQLLLIRGRPCVLTQSGLHLFEYLQHSKRLEQNYYTVSQVNLNLIILKPQSQRTPTL